MSLRPRLTSRRRPGVESALNKILAQLRVPRWVKGPVPADALGLAGSWQPVRRLWRPLPSERNTIKRVRAGKGIDSYSWLHRLTTPYPHPDSREPSTAQVSFDLHRASLKAAPESSTPFPKLQKNTLRHEEMKWLAKIRAAIESDEARVEDVSSTTNGIFLFQNYDDSNKNVFLVNKIHF